SPQVFANKEAVKLPDGGKAAAGRCRSKAAIVEIAKIGAHRIRTDGEEILPALRKKARVVDEIALIGGQRIGRRAPFRAHHLQERLDMMASRHGLGVSLLAGMRIVISRVFGVTKLAR